MRCRQTDEIPTVTGWYWANFPCRLIISNANIRPIADTQRLITRDFVKRLVKYVAAHSCSVG